MPLPCTMCPCEGEGRAVGRGRRELVSFVFTVIMSDDLCLWKDSSLLLRTFPALVDHGLSLRLSI